jgi:hypothetical protein
MAAVRSVNGSPRIPEWGVWLMFISSVIGAWLLAKELMYRRGIL